MRNQHDLGRRDGEFILSTPSEIENELPFQLVGAGIDFFQYPVERPFGFPVYQWIQTGSGMGVLECAAGTLQVPPGSGMLLYPEEPHTYHAADDDWHVNWITFSGHLAEGMLAYLKMPRTQVYVVSEPLAIEARIRKALQTLRSDYPLRGIDGSAIVYQLMLDFLKYVQKDGTASRDSHHMRLKPAMDYVEAHIGEPISLDALARTIGVTPQYFCDLFRAVTGQRPTEYLNRRRIDRARELLLLEPQTPIHEIARRTGYSSDSYFASVFRRLEGVTPHRYRESNANRRTPER